jgi:propionyl-CoA carboxylase beta chain
MPQEDPRITTLREMRAKTLEGGGAERVAKHHARGRLTARERLEILLDPGTMQELEPFSTAQGQEMGDKILGDGVVTAYGLVDGRTVYAYAQDFTVFGGALGETHSKKICRVMDLAASNGAPVIGLIDSGGARIQEGVKSLGGYSEIFKRNAQYSGVIPQISVMLGPCAGGASYSPALTDLIIMVPKQAFMFLTGPDVIKTVTGEVIDSESLGGADVHMGTSGTIHLTAASEREALALCRKMMGYLPSNNVDNPPAVECTDDPNRADEELNQIVPLDWTTPYSMHEVIARVVDHGTFVELQPAFARNAVIGLARLGGAAVGIVANEPDYLSGVMDIDSSDKITRFVRFCDCFNLPLVTFVDTPGFLPGVDQEHRGTIRHGAKVLYAYAEATVPKISVVTRKAYGGAYIVMSSKFLGSDINLGWPSAEIAVMGPEGAVNIIYRKQIESAADPETERAQRIDDYRARYLSPYAAASAGYLDDIIEPRETRSRVIAALSSLRNKYVPTLPRKHGNIPM